jgi:CelD/BcsL family acetyltransferase involved in cellulose biosynthesis
MKISLTRPTELSPSELSLWGEIQAANPALASPYFNAEFSLAAGEVRPDARVGVIEDGGRIVGFFPFQRRTGGVALPIAGPFTDWEGLIVSEPNELTLTEILRGCDITLYNFENAPSTPAFAPYVIARDGSHAIDLRDGFKSYVEQRRATGSMTYNMTGAKHRRLEKQLGPVRFVFDELDPAAFRQMLVWKSQQYRESRHVDVFRFGWAVEILERLLSERKPGFSGITSALYVRDELVAVHVGMRNSQVLHYWFPAYHPEYARFSPGLVLFYEMARQAALESIQTFDLGKGDYEFKRSVASFQIPLWEGNVSLPSLTTSLCRAERWGVNNFERLPLGKYASWPRRGLRRLRRELAFR